MFVFITFFRWSKLPQTHKFNTIKNEPNGRKMMSHQMMNSDSQEKTSVISMTGMQ